MVRLILRRLAIIPPALLLINFLGYSYAHIVRPLRAARIPYLFQSLPRSGALLPAYGAYLQRIVRFQPDLLPGTQQTIASAVMQAGIASLGLLALALSLSVLIGVSVGMRSVRFDPPRAHPWLLPFSTVGMAMPSFYLGSLFVLALIYYVIWQGQRNGYPLPLQGFGWDEHLILPILALILRPSVQIARMTSGMLIEEGHKQYVVAARSVGHTMEAVRRHHAMRNILAPVVLTVAGSLRLLMGELILVEWLFNWPGLGQLLAGTLVPASLSTEGLGAPLFLNPPVVAAVLTVFAALFLVAELITSVLIRVFDPRLRAPEGEGQNG